MNSRNAKNETSPNTISVAVSPSAKVTTSTAVMIHQAFTRACKLSMVARLLSDRARLPRIAPAAEATASNAITPPKTQIILSRGVIIASSPDVAREFDHCASRTLQERFFRFLWRKRNRHAEAHGAGHRNGQHCRLRHGTVQIVQIHRHELYLRELRGEMIQAALE